MLLLVGVIVHDLVKYDYGFWGAQSYLLPSCTEISEAIASQSLTQPCQ
jgi:hypothetical protein